jgi:hypothetical protein
MVLLKEDVKALPAEKAEFEVLLAAQKATLFEQSREHRALPPRPRVCSRVVNPRLTRRRTIDLAPACCLPLDGSAQHARQTRSSA